MNLDQAKARLESALVDFSSDLPEEALAVCLDSRDAEALALVTEAMRLFPDSDFLDDLWAAATDASASDTARAEAITAIGVVLLNADLELEIDEDELILTAEELADETSRLLGAYRDADFPESARRMALEMVANIETTPEVRNAGRAAYASSDPEWIATGVLVASLTDPDNRNDVVGEALESAHASVRKAAIAALAAQQDPASIETLRGLIFRAGDESDIEHALWALSDVPGAEIGQLLYDASESLHGDLASEAEEAYEAWLESWGGLDEYGDYDDEYDDEDYDDGEYDDDEDEDEDEDEDDYED